MLRQCRPARNGSASGAGVCAIAGTTANSRTNKDLAQNLAQDFAECRGIVVLRMYGYHPANVSHTKRPMRGHVTHAAVRSRRSLWLAGLSVALLFCLCGPVRAQSPNTAS